jgi:hypothetical protein
MSREESQFKPGQSGNPAGKPKGSRNRIQRNVIDAFDEHWAEHGKEAINIMFKERPADYLRFAANFLPKETIVQDIKPETEMSDEEFVATINKLKVIK